MLKAFFSKAVFICLIWQWLLSFPVYAQIKTPFELDSNTTTTYQEMIAYYEKLAESSPLIKLEEVGYSDIGKPIHSVTLSKSEDFEPASIRSSGKLILFVNNGIHAGEPCGIDATMMLIRDLAESKPIVLDSIVIVTIPAYNIGGMLNRNGYSRVNQDGPIAHGFRGNAKNLDLNRDFIKCDSKNAETFSRLFTKWQPDVFIDNHTTNGADYPYVMTLISTQKDKASPSISNYMQSQMLPALYKYMNEGTPYPMSTYVNVRSTPDDGIAGFLDLPRYSSGYATLHNCISFISEAHMLKPFYQRVHGTYQLMMGLLETMIAQKSSIDLARNIAMNQFLRQDSFDINWRRDAMAKDSIRFRGYRAKIKPSEVTGLDRMYYDSNDTYEEFVPYYDTYVSSATIKKPRYYLVPQGYQKVIDRLQWNGIRYQRISRDTTVEASYYYISDFETRKNPYESHFLHSQVELKEVQTNRKYYRGDVLVEVDQPGIRYIVETLEPQGADSFFAWNFFDGILMQKEYFSGYLFEETAKELLDEDEELRSAYDQFVLDNPDLKENGRALLDFIYKRSPHYEKTHRLYPIARIF